MRLARIRHYRCNEIDGVSYVLIPDEMSEDALQYLADSAVKAYLDAERAAAAIIGPKQIGYGPQYEKHPEKTVAEIKGEYDREFAQWKADEEIRKQGRLRFSDHLARLSDQKIKRYFDEDPSILEIEVSWGHNHGTDKDSSGDSMDGVRP